MHHRPMKAALATLLVLAGAETVSAQEAAAGRYTFASIPWGVSDSTVTATLAVAGFAFSREDEDGDLWYEGSLRGEHARIIALMTSERQLAKLLVDLITADEDAVPVYRQLRDQVLGSRYGEPQRSDEIFVSPYEAGEGMEEAALRDGKARFVAIWGDFDGDDYVGISITDILTVHLEYTSPLWGAELARRASLGDDLF